MAMPPPLVYTTYLGDDNVTWQIAASRKLAAPEAKNRVAVYLKRVARKKRPKPFDVVILSTVIGRWNFQF